MKAWMVLLMTGAAWASEPPHGCFKSVAEAVAVTHAFNGDAAAGFRVETLRRDVLHGTSWATVRSCEHPERPAAVVAVQSLKQERAGQAVDVVSVPVVRAGSEVRLIRTESNARLEMRGVTQANGAVGDRIAVRVLRTSEDGAVQMVMAVVRSADVLEMEP